MLILSWGVRGDNVWHLKEEEEGEEGEEEEEFKHNLLALTERIFFVECFPSLFPWWQRKISILSHKCYLQVPVWSCHNYLKKKKDFANNEDAAIWICCNSFWLRHVTCLNDGICDRNTTYYLFALALAFPSEKGLSTVHLRTPTHAHSSLESKEWMRDFHSGSALDRKPNALMSLRWPLHQSHTPGSSRHSCSEGCATPAALRLPLLKILTNAQGELLFAHGQGLERQGVVDRKRKQRVSSMRLFPKCTDYQCCATALCVCEWVRACACVHMPPLSLCNTDNCVLSASAALCGKMTVTCPLHFPPLIIHVAGLWSRQCSKAAQPQRDSCRHPPTPVASNWSHDEMHFCGLWWLVLCISFCAHSFNSFDTKEGKKYYRCIS